VLLAWLDFSRYSLPSTNPAAEANKLQLGEFSEEKLVAKQEQNIDQVNQEVQDSAKDSPTTFKQAMRSPESTHWKTAIKTELENLSQKLVWSVQQLPKTRKALGDCWLFAKKINNNGTTKFKAQYVAKGSNQKEGRDYAHTFAPKATFTSMQILLTVAAKHIRPV
jgi:hypothetical protein